MTDRAVRGPRERRVRKRTSPVTFYRQVVAELRKVVWPTQQQLVTYFIVVMVFVLVMIATCRCSTWRFGKAVFAIFDGTQPGSNQRQPSAATATTGYPSRRVTEQHVSEQYDEQPSPRWRPAD